MARTRTVKINNTILSEAFDSILSEEFGIKKPANNLLSEEVTKTDIIDITKKEIAKFLEQNRSQKFENIVRQMVVKEVKSNKQLESYIKEITKDTLVELYKALWTKRNFWTNELVK